MVEQKEFLNEASYQRAKKKIVRVSLLVLIIGVLIGGGLIVFGLIKMTNDATVEQIEYPSKEQIQADVDASQERVEKLEQEISSLRNEQLRIFRDDAGFSDAYYEMDARIDAKEAELMKQRQALSSYEAELWKIGSGFYDHSDSVSKMRYVPLFMVGGFVIIASAMISFAIYMFAKRREIVAFQAQQIMPIAQEGITKMAPTIGKAAASMTEEVVPTISKAAGSIAKEVARGIKEGAQDK